MRAAIYQIRWLLPLILLASVLQIQAQTPPGQVDGATLSSFLQELVTNFVHFKTTFINTVEATLGGYFAVLAYILAWIIAVYYFVQQFIQGEWDAAQIGRFTGSIVVCLMLLVYCGDLDQDGRRGDLVRTPAYVGYYLAFGEDQAEPTGSYINRLVNTERTKFNTNYEKFIENKLMVKINDQDMPVRYPGMSGIQTVAAVSIGQATATQEKEFLSQEFWIGLLFQMMNFCRSIIEIIDFFLLVLYSFGILVCSIIAPFMCCVFVNRDLRKRFTYPFLWTVMTVTVIFPFLSQTCRYFAYLASNMALGTSGNPIYTYDPQTFTIIAGGDPTPMILVAVLTMLISMVLLVMSLILSYSFAQGKLVESISGLIANTFAGLSSVGIGAAVTSMATKLSSEGEKTSIQGALESSNMQADYNLKAQSASAQASLKAGEALAASGYSSSMATATAQKQGAEMSAFGSLLIGKSNVDAEKFQSVNGAMANFRHNLQNMDSEEKKAYADNFVDLMSKNNDATSQRIAKVIEQEPEKLDMLAEQWENYINLIPVGSSVAKQFGLNKESMNAWMRTDGVKDLGQWFLGDPNTGKGGAMNGLSLPGSRMDKNAKANQEFLQSDGSSRMVWQRPDGTMVDPMSGREMSSNVIDMTDPNNVVDYSKNPSVAGIMGSGSGSGSGSRHAPQMGGAGGGGVSLKPTKKQRENIASLNQMMRQDPNFLPTLQRESWKRGIDPNDMLNMLAIESSFRKDVINSDGYLGLGQVGSKERRSLGSHGWTGNNQTDLARVKSMTPSQQLESLVFPFVDEKFGKRTKGLTMDKLYAGWGSGHYSNNPNYVHMEQGGKRSKAYNANPAWDVNKDGKVQQWEFGASAPKNLGAGVFFDAGQALGQIRAADPARAKVMAKRFSADAVLSGQMQNNQVTFEGKNQATGAYYEQKRGAEYGFAQEQMQIAGGKSQIQMSGIEQQYRSQIGSSTVVFQGQEQAADISRAGQLQSGQINYQGAMESARLSNEGQRGAAQITQKAALEALYKRNMSNMVQTVGNSAAHQFSELFERASRGL